LQPRLLRTEVPIGESAIFWDSLIQLIEEGRVIPVVGRDLLTVSDASGPRLLYPYLAERLADSLEVSSEKLPDGEELNEVACRFITAGNRVEGIYPRLKTVASRVEAALQVPEYEGRILIGQIVRALQVSGQVLEPRGGMRANSGSCVTTETDLIYGAN